MSGRGYVDPDFPNPGHPNDTDIIIYGYTPSLALACTAAAFFGVMFIASAGLTWKRQAKAAGGCILFGTAMEVVGYAMRSQSSKVDPYRLNFFVIQYFFIVVAPVFFSAAVYLLFLRALRLADGHKARIRPRLLFWTFLACDIVTTIIQVAGAASIGAAESNGKSPKTANNVLIAGLAIQTSTFCVFLVVFAYSVVYTHRGRLSAFPGELRPVRGWLIITAAAALLIQLRTAFRLAESAQGVFGYLSTHEVYFGTLEFLPIALAVLCLVALQFLVDGPPADPAVARAAAHPVAEHV